MEYTPTPTLIPPSFQGFRNLFNCCKTPPVEEEISLTKRDDSDLVDLEKTPPKLPYSVILGQGLQQIAILGFGVNTGFMIRSTTSDLVCNVTITDPLTCNYTADVEQLGPSLGLLQLGITVGAGTLFVGSFIGTYILTNRFLNSVEYKAQGD